MKSMIRKILLCVPILFISCSDVDDHQVLVSVSDDVLIIKNISSQTVFFFAVEQECAARINWVPHFNEPNLKGGEIFTIELNSIFNCESGPVKPGDKIILYYWEKSSDGSPEIKSKVVKI